MDNADHSPDQEPRYFAIVPAAGLSKRMGTHKLLLRNESCTLIETVLAAWSRSRVTATVAIFQSAMRTSIKSLELSGTIALFLDHPTIDMKATVAYGLEWIADHHEPTDRDAWLLSPADYPGIASIMIDRLIAFHREQSTAQILVPAYRGRSGHPTLFPWECKDLIGALPPDAGINHLLQSYPTRKLECMDENILVDIDTPEDAARANYHIQSPAGESFVESGQKPSA